MGIVGRFTVALINKGAIAESAKTTVRFATLTDSEAEPIGIYFDKSGTTLYANIQHRGGDGADKTLAITKK